MSVLIRGMEMPTSCDECVFYRKTDPVYDYCCISSATPKGCVPNDCPLIEVPTPHGRLIDADAILGKINAIISAHPDEADLYEQDAVIVRDWLRSEPTIIESDHLRDNTKMVERESKNVSN
jgi:hypothetical protein